MKKGKEYPMTIKISAARACLYAKPSNQAFHYEEEYLQTIALYKDSDPCHEFPKAFACLIREMGERRDFYINRFSSTNVHLRNAINSLPSQIFIEIE